MKKMNLLVMSLVSAAALSFSSCSSNDDLTSGGAGTQSQVKGFYMRPYRLLLAMVQEPLLKIQYLQRMLPQ